MNKIQNKEVTNSVFIYLYTMFSLLGKFRCGKKIQASSILNKKK